MIGIPKGRLNRRSETQYYSATLTDRISFSADGLYMADFSGTVIYVYTMSPAFDLSTLTLDSSINLSTGSSNNQVCYADNGNLMFYYEGPTNTLTKLSLPTPYSLTGNSVAQTASISVGTNTAMHVGHNGFSIYFCTPGIIKEYSMSTAFDLSTISSNSVASYNKSDLRINDGSTSIRSFGLSPDGSKIAVTTNAERIHLRNLAFESDLSGPIGVTDGGVNVQAYNSFGQQCHVTNDASRIFYCYDGQSDIEPPGIYEFRFT